LYFVVEVSLYVFVRRFTGLVNCSAVEEIEAAPDCTAPSPLILIQRHQVVARLNVSFRSHFFLALRRSIFAAHEIHSFRDVRR
jgi:hypothetical protein